MDDWKVIKGIEHENSWRRNHFRSIDTIVSKNKIGFHVVNYKYHTTVSYHEYNYEPTRNYATLYYLIENNHLYEITNQQEQKSISHRQQLNTFKHKEKKIKIRNIHIFYKPEDILVMLGLCQRENGDHVFKIEECKCDIFVCYTPTVVHELFYMLLKNESVT